MKPLTKAWGPGGGGKKGVRIIVRPNKRASSYVGIPGIRGMKMRDGIRQCRRG